MKPKEKGYRKKRKEIKLKEKKDIEKKSGTYNRRNETKRMKDLVKIE